MTDKTPSQKIVKSIFDGAQIKDSLGRTLKLRTPDIIDEMKIREATKYEDSINREMANLVLHFSMICEDGKDFVCPQPPRTLQDCEGLIKKIGHAGFNALFEFVQANSPKNQNEELVEIKK